MRAQAPAKSTAVTEDGRGAQREHRARYVAIVSDGSARWAHARGLEIAAGHDAAADTVVARVSDAVELGIHELTVYAFSTENWARPRTEVAALFGMLAERIAADTPALHSENVRVRFIGRRDRGGPGLLRAMQASEALTRTNTGLQVYVAFDYGGRDEILKAAGRYRGGGEAEFAKLMHASEMHDPDLVIRTSGEKRLSNFLLWQSAYSELVFRDELWPDFNRAAFEECLAEYAERTRRFGGREPQDVGTTESPWAASQARATREDSGLGLAPAAGAQGAKTVLSQAVVSGSDSAV